MNKDTIKFPAPANPNIEEVLDSFIEDRRRQLKPATTRKYEDIVKLFKDSMDGYAYQYLDKGEAALFDNVYNAEGEAHREFCQVFGPEKIPSNVGEFLGYFMPRKVMCGKELMKAAGTVMKKLGKWLNEQGYIDDEWAENMVKRGAEAVTNLPAAEELAEMLYEYANAHPTSKWTDEIEDYFTVEKVEPGKLHLSAFMDRGEDIIVVSVPKKITDLCKVGWDISLFLGKTSKGWKIIESGGVYTH
ncbi:MAG: hypothetical protein ACE5HX_14110 [bacterium]